MSPRSLIKFLLAAASPMVAQAASGSGRTTRYWDCCKPSCAWEEKAPVSAPVLTCSKNDSPLRDPEIKSGCDGGSAFACGNNSPIVINDDLAFGFAATAISGQRESNWCCACYALTFTSGPVAGKTMVVQSTNTGGDLGSNHFDIQMPGGGVGLFDGCTPQFGGIPGERYGGVTSRSQCEQMPSFLKAGCHWRFDWFKNADNPNIDFKQVRCPKALTDITGCVRSDDGQFPVFEVPSGGSSTSSTRAATTLRTTSTSTSSGPGPSSPGGTVPIYGQCGGQGWTGPTICASGSKCQSFGQWYSQCVPA